MKSAFKPLALSLALAIAFPALAASTTQADDVIVTANRLAQLSKDVLADHVVISAEQIALSGASTVVELLQQQRGIEVARNGGPGTVASVFMRGGNNAQNVVLIDGVRVGNATTGGVTWSSLPLAQVERIEIVYGPLSSQYGADAMNGVIQIFTKKGQGKINPVVSAGFGSFGTRKAAASITGSTVDNLSYAFSIAHEEADGFNASKPGAGKYTYNPDKDGYTQDSASGRVVWSLAKDSELGLQFLQNRINAQFDAGASYDDRTVQKLETLSVFGKTRISPIWTTQLMLSQSADKAYTDASYGKSQIDTTQQQLQWQNDLILGQGVLQVNAETREEKVSTPTTALNGKRRTNSLATAYVLKQDQHLMSASLRYDRSSVYGNNTTGSLAYGYKIDPVWRVNASYGTSFRAPTYNELYYPGYGISTNQPEKSKNAEIGLYAEQSDWQFSAVYYQNKVTDLIVNNSICPVQQATHPYGCAYNVNRAKLSGFTLGGSVKLEAWTARASWDIQDPKDETTGLRLARRAKQHATLAVDYQQAQWKAGAEVIVSGERFDDVANKNALASYGLLNLYVSANLTPELKVLARVNNLADKDYELARNYTSSGRNAFVGLTYSFK